MFSNSEMDTITTAFDHGGFITGGYAVFRSGCTVEYGDIDFYFPTEKAFWGACRELKEKKMYCLYTKSGYVQVDGSSISLNYVHFGTPEEVCDMFDLRICRKYILGDIDSPVISYDGDNHCNFDPAVVRPSWDRLMKYASRIDREGISTAEVESFGMTLAYFVRTYWQELFGRSKVQAYPPQFRYRESKLEYDTVNSVLLGEHPWPTLFGPTCG